MLYENNKGANPPTHPRSLISAFVFRCLDSIILLLAIAEISRLYLVSVAVQAGLCLTWSLIPKTGSLDVAQLLYWRRSAPLLFAYGITAFLMTWHSFISLYRGSWVKWCCWQPLGAEGQWCEMEVFFHIACCKNFVNVYVMLPLHLLLKYIVGCITESTYFFSVATIVPFVKTFARDIWTASNEFGIAYASSEGSGKQWVKRNLQTESQIPGFSEWLGMRS